MVTQPELDIIDSGRVTAPAQVGTNALNDNTKNWATDVHKNRLVRIVSGPGMGQIATVESNTAKSLVIKGSWTAPLDTSSQYVILGVDVAQVIREVLGGGLNVDLPAEFSDLKAALAIAMEAAVDSGTATGGSNTTIVDTSKNWQVNMWVDAVAEVVIGGVHYLRLVTANTADTITINALPGGVACAAGCEYSLKRPVTTVDVTDRAARLLGVVQSLIQWGGVALTGRDISLDLAKLDIALSAFRDALKGAAAKDFSTLETDVEGILGQLDITLSALKAVGAETPRTLSNLYDHLGSILGQLDITLTSLRDALRGAGTKDFTTLEADIESILANIDVALSTRATETELAKKLNKATTPTKYALTITNADTEYSQALPANTKQFSVHLRDMSAFRLAYETGKVATPTDPYETVPAGSEKYVENIEPASLTLYIAAPAGTKVAEIEAWA